MSTEKRCNQIRKLTKLNMPVWKRWEAEVVAKKTWRMQGIKMLGQKGKTKLNMSSEKRCLKAMIMAKLNKPVWKR